MCVFGGTANTSVNENSEQRLDDEAVCSDVAR